MKTKITYLFVHNVGIIESMNAGRSQHIVRGSFEFSSMKKYIIYIKLK